MLPEYTSVVLRGLRARIVANPISSACVLLSQLDIQALCEEKEFGLLAEYSDKDRSFKVGDRRVV